MFKCILSVGHFNVIDVIVTVFSNYDVTDTFFNYDVILFASSILRLPPPICLDEYFLNIAQKACLIQIKKELKFWKCINSSVECKANNVRK